MSFANVVIVGRCGKDADVRMTQTGKEMASVSVAVGTKDKTTWFRVVGFDKTAQELAKLQKGDQVFIQGGIKLNTYTTKTGETRSDLEVMAGIVRSFTKSEAPALSVVEDSDVPF